MGRRKETIRLSMAGEGAWPDASDYPWLGKEHCQVLLHLTNLQAGADQGSNINRKHLLTSSLESDIVGDELDVVLHLHAWVSCLFQNGISLAPRMNLRSDI
jgi:hypothetical protein